MAALRALCVQLAAWALLLGGCLVLGRPFGFTPLAVLLQGALAAGLSRLIRDPRWWLPIHLAFSPLLFLAVQLALPPAVPLAVLAGLTFVYWTTFRGEVPLFSSTPAVAQALLAQLPQEPGARVLDLGAGTGRLLKTLAQARPDAHFLGIEHAPLPWLLAWLHCRKLANVRIERRNFWHHPLTQADLVFVFLSPAVLPRLEAKARREMRPGSRLVSSDFALPGARAEQTLSLPDRRRTQLHCYRIPLN